MADLIDRQKAIDAFYIQSDDDGWWTGTAEDMEKLLKALPSAQPTQTNTLNTLESLDCVSRQAVKEWLAKWEGYIDKDTIARMQYRVIDIPSAQPERKTGRWITQTTHPYGTQCGNCGWAWSKNIDAVKIDPIFSCIRTAYCPNCGARMMEVEHENLFP